MKIRTHDLVKERSQFLIATHSPIIMAYPNSRIYLLGDSGFEVVQYTQTPHYTDSKRFLNDHERMLRMLLDE